VWNRLGESAVELKTFTMACPHSSEYMLTKLSLGRVVESAVPIQLRLLTYHRVLRQLSSVWKRPVESAAALKTFIPAYLNSSKYMLTKPNLRVREECRADKALALMHYRIPGQLIVEASRGECRGTKKYFYVSP